MWQKFKWDMFVTSFIPLWISIIVIDIWDFVLIVMDKWDKKVKTLENIVTLLSEGCIQIISIIAIVIVVLCSIAGINTFLRKLNSYDNNPKATVLKVTKANKLSSEFLLAYILPMIAFDFGDLQNLSLFLIYFAVLAFLCIRNNNIYTNIFLEFKGYRMFICDLECTILEEKHTYHDSLVISRDDLTQEEKNNVSYWDFDNYIYITESKGEK